MDTEYVESKSTWGIINDSSNYAHSVSDSNQGKKKKIKTEKLQVKIEENISEDVQENEEQERKDAFERAKTSSGIEELQNLMYKCEDKKYPFLDNIKQEEIEIVETALCEYDSSIDSSSGVPSNFLNEDTDRPCDENKCEKIQNKNLIKNNKAGLKQYHCKECGYSSRSLANLRVHSRIHTGEKPYTCTHCDYRARQRTALMQHLRTHTGERPFNCSKCGYSAVTCGALKRHSYTHSEEKPFKCVQCSYSTTTKYFLEAHIKLHSGLRPFVCKLCWYETTNERCLKQHHLSHIENKSFKCIECSYSTRQKKDLESHMTSHIGEKPFECYSCNYKCTKKAYLKAHMKTRHHYKYKFDKSELPKVKPRSSILKSDQLTFSFKF